MSLPHLQLLTCTGARPVAFATVERWAAAQTYAGRVTWVIVDDGPESTPITRHPAGWLQVVIRPAPLWRPGQNTQARNMLKGLEAIDRAQPLVIVEDDDWLAADWLETVARQLERAELVGEHRARYYNVPRRVGRQLNNTKHASLCATALRGPAINSLIRACQRAPKFIDLELWRTHRSRHLFAGHRVVGIKGLPGRGGIGIGHRDKFDGQDDSSGDLLRQWVGAADAEVLLSCHT